MKILNLQKLKRLKKLLDSVSFALTHCLPTRPPPFLCLDPELHNRSYALGVRLTDTYCFYTHDSLSNLHVSETVGSILNKLNLVWPLNL